MSLKGIPRHACLALLLASATMTTAQMPPQGGRPVPEGEMPAAPPTEVQPAPGVAGSPEDPSAEPDLAPSPQRRDPFWPVGYAPVRPVRATPKMAPGAGPGGAVAEPEPTRSQDWEQARRHLDFRGLSTMGRDKVSGNPRFVAMMGGKLVESGDTVAASFEGQVYRWKIVAIGSNGVSMVKLDVRAE